jgi:hypothetical protein
LARSAAACWGLVVALTSLAAALAVYDLTRALPPALLEPLRVPGIALPLPAWLSSSAPSFFYTLAFALLTGLAAVPARARRHCLAWTALALGFELAQLPSLAAPIAAWLSRALPPPLWQTTAAYWTAGTFDPNDLAATAAAGLLALLLLRRLTTGAPR